MKQNNNKNLHPKKKKRYGITTLNQQLDSQNQTP